MGLVGSRAFISDKFEQSYRTTALAIVEIFFLLGRALGPIISGIMIDLTTVLMTFNTFNLIIAVCILGIIIVFSKKIGRVRG